LKKYSGISKIKTMFKLIKILGLYFSLSAQGKKLFRRLYRMLKDAKKMPHYAGMMVSIDETMSADQERWFACIRSSDRAFKEFIPAWYIALSKVKPEQLYYRFFKMGAILLYEHLSLFSAYNIRVDFAGQKRCLLFAFLKRVYDDLLDNEHIDKTHLFSDQPRPELLDNAEYRLLLEFRKKIRVMAQPERFPNYYALLKEVNDAQGLSLSVKSANKAIPYKIKNGFLLDMYIMMNALPGELIRAMDVTAEFFAYLDDFYDYEQDLAQGKATDINQSQNAQSSLEQKFQQAADYLRANSPNPDGYLKGIGNLMKNVIFTRQSRLNKLSAFI
jgi:hypothetical protein